MFCLTTAREMHTTILAVKIARPAERGYEELKQAIHRAETSPWPCKPIRGDELHDMILAAG